MYKTNNLPQEKGRIDWFTVLTYLMFVILGWFNIYAASFD